jgi:hypothetical protein
MIPLVLSSPARLSQSDNHGQFSSDYQYVEMKILASSVLAMEIMVMGFAVLLASKNHGAPALIWGGVIAGLLLLAVATLRIRVGWVLGSALQIALVGYGFIATPLFFLGALFMGLWIAAIFVGRKGEAARAAFLKTGETRGQ